MTVQYKISAGHRIPSIHWYCHTHHYYCYCFNSQFLQTIHSRALLPPLFLKTLQFSCVSQSTAVYESTGWRTKCHTIDCAHNTYLLLKKHLTSGTELILIGWKIVPYEEHVQYDHHFASQPLANEPLHSSQLFDTSLQKARGTTSLCGPW